MIVSGLVQGVGYRYFALKRAQERGLVGSVRNLPDGRVEIVAEGSEEALDAFQGDLKIGPRFSKVSAVDSSPIDPRGDYTSFSMVR